MLMAYGAQVCTRDLRGDTPLLAAVTLGNLEMVKILVQETANGDGEPVLDAANGKLQTPLCVASRIGNVEIVEVLVACGAKISEKDRKGGTPLSIACKRGHSEVVKVLARAGAVSNNAGSNEV
jgi:ankyrin repeat protein